MHLVMVGNVHGMPMLLKDNLEHAYKVLGEHSESARGEMTKKMVGRMKVDVGLKSVSKNLCVYMDVMHVDEKKFHGISNRAIELDIAV